MHVPLTEIILSHDGAELMRATLPPGEYVIGREAGVDLHAETPLLSRRHARLTINYDHLLIEDLGSANGTFVNDQPLAECTRLFPNQSIRLGPDLALEVRRQRAPTEPGVSLAPAQAAIRRFLPEEILAEKRYAIGSQIARGGMGAILDARQNATQRTVAMKVMLDGADEADVLRFIEEAQVTAQLDHPNIVPIYELGVDEQDQLFYTMKLVRGITLKKVLELLGAGTADAVKKYPLPALLTIFQKVCDALAFAHSRGVIHRDLKPENIMLGDFGEVLVMDWGLAKVLGGTGSRASHAADDAHLENHAPAENQGRAGALPSAIFSARAADAVSATMTGSIMGTPAYMSPEQARGEIETLDARSDIYALGAILFELLHLRPVVTGASAMEIVDKVARGTVEWEGATPKGRPVPDSLRAVCRKALALDADARYARVEDLQRDLAAYQGGFATSAENAGVWKQLTLLMKRHKATTLGVAAVLLVGSGFGTKAVIEGRRAEREAARAKAEARRAEQALADLKKTAPRLLALAESEIGFQQFESAVANLDAAVALDPGLTAAYWQRAWALIALERWPEAAAALTQARERDPAHAARAAILPVIEQLAASSDDTTRWTAERTAALYRHLSAQKAAGPLTALARRFQLGGKERVGLIRQRLDEWLGKGVGKVEVLLTGRVKVSDLPITIDTLEPLRGLPIDSLDVRSRWKITSLEPLRGMPLAGLTLSGMPIRDLSPLRGMRLLSFDAREGSLSDLTPLAGMPLQWINLSNSQVRDITALRGMPLQEAFFHYCSITDYSPLQGMPLRRLALGLKGSIDLGILAAAPLEFLNCDEKQITDLTPLRGKPLRELEARSNKISDLTPLAGLPLVTLNILGNPIADYSPLLKVTALERLSVSAGAKKHPSFATLRQHPTLQTITLSESGTPRPVAQFWADYDAEQAAAKK